MKFGCVGMFLCASRKTGGEALETTVYSYYNVCDDGNLFHGRSKH